MTLSSVASELPAAEDRAKRKAAQTAKKRKRFQNEKRRYTTIWHAVREQFDLSVAEYVMCDVIYGLSANRGAVPGWCYASKKTLGAILGVTRPGAQKIINRLVKKGLVETDEQTGYLRPTEEWIYAVELQKEDVYGHSAD